MKKFPKRYAGILGTILMVFLTSGIIGICVTYWAAESMKEFHARWFTNWMHGFLIAMPALVVVRPLVTRIVDWVTED